MHRRVLYIALAAAAVVGVKDVTFLREPDGMLQPTLELRKKLVREIRRFKPEIVICGDPTIVWAGDTYINHPDHRAAATAALDAIFPAAGQPNLFEELADENITAHKPRKVYVTGWNGTDLFVNIEETIDIKIAALREHKSQMKDWDPDPLIKEWAAEHGFEVAQDAAGSMTIKVPATPGHENAPTIILQGHLDMVCEKNADVEHDFMTQGIEVEVDGDWVRARGTTLGADNGIGLAAAMALADDPDVVHGPLEILATVDEETGLTGAKMLDASMIQGRILLNLDTEEDGAIYMGCAGGADADAFLKVSRRRGLLGSVPVNLAIRGLAGGHSGLNIIENRANAIKSA